MHPNQISKTARFADQPSPRVGASALDPPPYGATLRLTRRAALSVVLVLSLGLWAAIWAAVASLASAALG